VKPEKSGRQERKQCVFKSAEHITIYIRREIQEIKLITTALLSMQPLLRALGRIRRGGPS
jgi:hypothetical protein